MGSAGMSAENWMLTGLYLILWALAGSNRASRRMSVISSARATCWLCFGWFYISINVGAALSTLATPLLLEWYGPHWAFGVPGVLMAVATLVFWMGRKVFVHIPARGNEFVKEVFSPEGYMAVGKLFIIFLFVAVFWALFDQTGSSWVLQAEDLDRNWLGIHWLSSQIRQSTRS